VKVRLARVAEQELVEAARHYAQRGGLALGEAFIGEFERCSALLAERPGLGAPFRGTIRRLPMRRFPYSLFYDVRSATLRILAIAHQRRRPGYWVGRR
jgi:plasmid stabilization system protein ParE